MDNILVIGGGGHAKVIINIIKKDNKFNILGYLDFFDKGDILGVKYLGDDKIITELIYGGLKNVVIGIGRINASEERNNVIQRFLKYDIYYPNIISNNAVINDDIKFGKGAHVFDGVVINPGTILKDFCIINTNATIEHDCVVGEYTHIAPGVTISGGVNVGSNVLIGAGSTLIQGIRICNNVVIGAGSVVIKNIEESGTYVGNPCRRIR